MMCHLLLALPILMLPVFWLWPLAIALPVYIVAASLAFAFYWYAMKAMRQPVDTGAEGMLGAIGEVTQIDGRQAMLFVRSELWAAETDGAPLAIGDRVRVESMDGLTLKVQRLSATELKALDWHF